MMKNGKHLFSRKVQGYCNWKVKYRINILPVLFNDSLVLDLDRLDKWFFGSFSDLLPTLLKDDSLVRDLDRFDKRFKGSSTDLLPALLKDSLVLDLDIRGIPSQTGYN